MSVSGTHYDASPTLSQAELEVAHAAVAKQKVVFRLQLDGGGVTVERRLREAAAPTDEV